MLNPISTCPKDGSFFILIDGRDRWPAWWDAKEKIYPLRFIDTTEVQISEDSYDTVIINGYAPPFDETCKLFWLPFPSAEEISFNLWTF